MTVLQDIRDVRELLGPEGEHWCKGYYAVSRYGYKVNPLYRAARRWCLAGAFHKVTGKSESNAQSLVRAEIPHAILVGFNDRSTWAEVDDLLDRAERRAEELKL